MSPVRVRRLPARTMSDLREQLDALEDRYGVPSARFSDAFRDADGVLTETDDFLRWSSLYACWRIVTEI